jgi:hypothetical protein
MSYEAINFGKKFKLFDEQWQPKVVAAMNDYRSCKGTSFGTITRARMRHSLC